MWGGPPLPPTSYTPAILVSWRLRQQALKPWTAQPVPGHPGLHNNLLNFFFSAKSMGAAEAEKL